jgi:aspartate/methionine/tyrosine aminotransferase
MSEILEDRSNISAVDESGIPLDREALSRIVDRERFDLRRASIREMNSLIDTIERELGVRYVRMEFGIPGLPTHRVAVDAEIEALRTRRVGHVYAPFEGLPALKKETARFVRLFMDLDVPPDCCIPVVGAMEGCFAALALAGRMRSGARTVLCLEPGFPVNKLQLRFLGLERETIDFYDHRGDNLIRAVEERVQKGDICAILWSSPNNPAWVTLKDSELKGLGRICDERDLIAIEDLAYFGMDVREDYYRPGEPPYQPSVLRHTKRGICLISSSKIFSYAGQRIAMAVVSPKLFDADVSDLTGSLGTPHVGHAFVHGILYPIAACVPESPQYGLLALLQAANGGDSSVFEPARVYARRAEVMKRLFLDNGFRLVYDNDLGEPLADGFYFTIAYPGFADGFDLLRELLHYGISAITLETTGSCRKEGLRACVSLVGEEQFGVLEARLKKFRQNHPGSAKGS